MSLTLFAETVSFTAETTSSGDGAAVGGALIGMSVFYLALYLVMGFIVGKIFVKAGKPLWAGFVPIYNIVVFLEIIGKPIWWIILLFVPVANFVVSIIFALELGKKFGKSGAYSFFLLWWFSLIGYAMLAFGSDQYEGAAPAAQAFGVASPPAAFTPDPITSEPQQETPPTQPTPPSNPPLVQ